jgi:1,4-dihydroxy-2-naphthoyl-CoA synthase
VFKNRHFQVKLAKDDALPDTVDALPVDPVQIAQITTEAAIKIIAVAGVAVAANRVLKTVCEVAVVVAKAKIK